MKKISAAQIKIALVKTPGWKKKGASISRTFQFKDFPVAIKFVDAIANLPKKNGTIPTLIFVGTK
ncbi:MAG: 4a-hydroxytetrahydrobiopterin dehydratase [Limisphaerales bacterium]